MNLRINILANLAGRLWTAMMSFAFVPLYIRLLGIEGYALIGLFSVMMTAFLLFDLGFSLTVNRELAKLSHDASSRTEARDLLRTIETIYWAVGVLIFGIVALASEFIANRWLNHSRVSVTEVTHSIRLMALAGFFRWPVSMYLGGLMGLQRQVEVNIVSAAAATLAGAGSIGALYFYHRSTTVFFAWQALVSAAQIAVLRSLTWGSLPLANHSPRLDFVRLRKLLPFFAGVSGTTILSVLLTQSDKLLLSRTLPLAEFGYYSLATNIATLLMMAGAAVESAVFPPLTRAASLGAKEEEARLYHMATQAVALLVIPIVMALSFFPRELLLLYVGNSEVAAHVATILPLLVIGTGFLAIMCLPYSLQMAHGWTKLSVQKSVLAVLLFIPTLLFLSIRFGARGAAFSWLMLTASYFVFEVLVMHRRLLIGEQWKWYLRDIGVPLALNGAAFALARVIVGSNSSAMPGAIGALVAAGLGTLAAIMALPAPRTAVLAAVGLGRMGI